MHWAVAAIFLSLGKQSQAHIYSTLCLQLNPDECCVPSSYLHVYNHHYLTSQLPVHQCSNYAGTQRSTHKHPYRRQPCVYVVYAWCTVLQLRRYIAAKSSAVRPITSRFTT